MLNCNVLKRFLCSMCCLWVVTCLVLNYLEPVMGPPRSSWFLGHVHAGEGSDSLESPWIDLWEEGTQILGRKENYPSRKVAAAWHFLAMSVRGEVVKLPALVKRKTHSEPLQQSNCSTSAQLLMPSKLKSKRNKNVFPAIQDEKSRAALLVVWNS